MRRDFFDAATVVEVVKFEAAQGWAALTAAVRKRDVFVGGAAFFCYFSFAAERK